MNNSSEKHWQTPTKWWNFVGSPLRPSDEDLELLKREVLSRLKLVSSSSEIKQVALLGVTSEIATLPWTDDTNITAIDSSHEMIKMVWPSSKVTRGKAICADWRQIPLADNSCDLVVGDGGFTLLDYPNGYKMVLQEVFRILKPGGLLAIRFFLSPSKSEDVETVFEELLSKELRNFNVFKLRLAMALQESVERGIPVRTVWERWQQNIINSENFLQSLDLPMELISTINVYKDSPSVYTFPTLKEVRKLFLSDFLEVNCFFPSYELGERCPSILFRSKKP